MHGTYGIIKIVLYVNFSLFEKQKDLFNGFSSTNHIQLDTPQTLTHWMKMYWIRLKFPMGPINNVPSWVQIMAWRRSGDQVCTLHGIYCTFSGAHLQWRANEVFRDTKVWWVKYLREAAYLLIRRCLANLAKTNNVDRICTTYPVDRRLRLVYTWYQSIYRISMLAIGHLLFHNVCGKRGHCFTESNWNLTNRNACIWYSMIVTTKISHATAAVSQSQPSWWPEI